MKLHRAFSVCTGLLHCCNKYESYTFKTVPSPTTQAELLTTDMYN